MRTWVSLLFSSLAVKALVNKGFDAAHLQSRGLRKLADPHILGLAQQEQRILLTHDPDFSDLVAATSGELHRVVVFRLRDMRPDNVIRHILLLLDRYKKELTNGAIFSITEERIRFRLLPLHGEKIALDD